MLSANEGWAVGDSGTIIKWNGTSWSSFTSPSSSRNMTALSMVSSTLGWAAADTGNILKWDGSSWTIVVTPVTTNLSGIAMTSTTNGWAVGSGGVILKWDGTAWSSATSPTTRNINAITMVSATDGRAVGDSGTILNWNGTGWATVTGSTTNSLYGIGMTWFSATGGDWQNPTNAYADDDAGADATDTMTVGGDRHQYFNFGFAAPPGLTLAGLEADASAWVTSPPDLPSPPAYPSSSGSFKEWAANTGTDVTATGAADADDTTYIDTAGVALSETFKVSNAGAPTGATVDSITVYAVAKASGSAPSTLQLMEESSTSKVSLDPTVHTLTNAYQTYSYSFTKRPDGTSWSQSEVNAWTSRFGVRTTGGSFPPRVTQIYVKVNYH